MRYYPNTNKPVLTEQRIKELIAEEEAKDCALMEMAKEDPLK